MGSIVSTQHSKKHRPSQTTQKIKSWSSSPQPSRLPRSLSPAQSPRQSGLRIPTTKHAPTSWAWALAPNSVPKNSSQSPTKWCLAKKLPKFAPILALSRGARRAKKRVLKFTRIWRFWSTPMTKEIWMLLGGPPMESVRGPVLRLIQCLMVWLRSLITTFAQPNCKAAMASWPSSGTRTASMNPFSTTKWCETKNEDASHFQQLQFKWGNMHCGPSPTVPIAQRRRAVCVTLDDMSFEEGYAQMDLTAPAKIKNEIRKMMNALRNAAIVLGLFMTFIFTGCCFCCCFCCCCKPCRGGDSTPVVTQTTQVQQQAAPAPAPVQQFAPAPAPAPMMPAYAQPAPYNPYAQPMMQPMQQQQPMGGLNLNISNNNTNTNGK